MSGYCEVSHVTARLPILVGKGGGFSSDTRPSDDQVTAFIGEVSAEIDGALLAAGVDPRRLPLLDMRGDDGPDNTEWYVLPSGRERLRSLASNMVAARILRSIAASYEDVDHEAVELRADRALAQLRAWPRSLVKAEAMLQRAATIIGGGAGDDE